MEKSLLLLDDRQAHLRELARQLAERGYRCTTLAPRADVLAHLAQLPSEPDLMFISLLEPQAVATCESLRNHPAGAIVPIILVGSGQEAITSPAEALAQGADFFFKLPLDVAAVHAKVRTYLGEASAPSERAEPLQPNTKAATTATTPASAPAAAAAPTGASVTPIRSAARQHGGPLTGASDALLAHIREREAQLQVAAHPARQRPKAATLPSKPQLRAQPAPTTGAGEALVPAEGSLTVHHDMAHLLHEIWRQRVTGRVDFSSGKHIKALFFSQGVPCYARSSQVYDRIEEYLFRQALITRAQYHHVRTLDLQSPRRVGAYLVTEGFLKPHELFAAVRGHLQETVIGLFEWQEGSYCFSHEQASPDDQVTLDTDPPALILDGIRRKYLMPRLLQRVGGPSSLLAPKEGAELHADALRLSSGERLLVRLLDGTRSIEDLVFSSRMDGESVYQLLAALLAIDYAHILVRGIEGLASDGTSAGDVIDRDRIQNKIDQVRKLDYFQILGLARQATPYEIDRAYQRHLQEYSPEFFTAGVRQEFRSELAEIRQVIDDARSVLGDEALRQAYAQNLA